MRKTLATGEHRERLRAIRPPTAMLGLIRGSGTPPESRGWPHSVLWRLGGFFFLLLLEGAGCLVNPSSPSGVNNPSVNIYMSVEEVKKLLGKKAVDAWSVCVGLSRSYCGQTAAAGMDQWKSGCKFI